jgi:hypothetical protein
VAYVGIKLFRLFTNTANPKIQGMLAGVMFRQKSYNTLLGLEAQYPYGPYSTWNYGRNPIFTQVRGVPFRLMIKPGIQHKRHCVRMYRTYLSTSSHKLMSLFNSPSTGPDDDSHLVPLWWMCLIGIAIFNCGILLRSARAFHASNRVAYPPRLRSIRDTQLVMSSIYVYGCAYRSILPTHHTLRRVLIRSNASSGFVGRTVATIAELGAAYQSSLLLYEVGTATNERDALIITTSRIIVPMLTIAEIFSWIACTTTNYAGSIIEEGLWAICALLVASCLAKCLVLYEVGGEQRDFVLRAVREREREILLFHPGCYVYIASRSLLLPLPLPLHVSVLNRVVLVLLVSF